VSIIARKSNGEKIGSNGSIPFATEKEDRLASNRSKEEVVQQGAIRMALPNGESRASS